MENSESVGGRSILTDTSDQKPILSTTTRLGMSCSHRLKYVLSHRLHVVYQWIWKISERCLNIIIK
jgi:hypothetical protein